MNIYNVIGLSQNCENEKILKRIEIMLNFYYNDNKKIETEIDKIEQNKITKKDINNIKEFQEINEQLKIDNKIHKLQTQRYNTKKIIGELEKAKHVFKGIHLRINYDNYLKNNPKLTMEQFFIKENIMIQYNNSTEKKLEFNPNQRENYVEKYVKNVEYNMYLNQEQFEIYSNDEKVRISVLGRLDYTNAMGVKDIGFYKYRIEKARIMENYNEKKSYNIFSGINIKRISEDLNYKEYNLKVLFSDINIKIAIEHNGGYIGEILEDGKDGLCVYHRTRKIMCCYRK